MTRQAVKSSAIKAIGFENGVIEVEMPNGCLYTYACTQAEHDDLIAAPSIGQHFREHFRSRPFTKIVPQKVEA